MRGMINMADLQKEFDFYLAHQDDLVEKYNGRFLVIKDDQVQGDFDAQMDAYTWATERFALGTFLIQRVSPGDEAYSQTFYSRVGA